MEKQTNLLEAIKASSAIKRGPNESTLNFLTRSLEISAGLKRTVPDPGAACVKAAVRLRNQASKSKPVASAATTLASQVTKALPPKPSSSCPQAGRIARQIAAAATAAPALAFLPDSKLIEAATHRFAPEAGRAEAIAELGRRGITISANGIVSKNLKSQIK